MGTGGGLHKIRSFAQDGKTIILVSHIPKLIRKTCNQILLLNQGSIIEQDGLSILDKYLNKPLTNQSLLS